MSLFFACCDKICQWSAALPLFHTLLVQKPRSASEEKPQPSKVPSFLQARHWKSIAFSFTLCLLSKLWISNLYPPTPSSFKFMFTCSSSNIKCGMMGTDLWENQILTSDVRLCALPWHGCHGWLGGKSHSQSAMSHTDLQPWMQQTHYCITIAA